jgi:hypothetical protein
MTQIYGIFSEIATPHPKNANPEYLDNLLLLSAKTIQGGKSVDLLMCETHCACQFEELVRTV